MANHKVRVHSWVKGVLDFADHAFEKLEDALGFAEQAKGDHVKVYNNQGHLIHDTSKITDNKSAY